jgi:uncharacterized protein
MDLAPGIPLPASAIAELCRRYHVKELSVFGSAARGDMRPDSDIDRLVDFDAGARVGLIAYAGLMLDLSSLLGRKVDLVDKAGLKPRFGTLWHIGKTRPRIRKPCSTYIVLHWCYGEN